MKARIAALLLVALVPTAVAGCADRGPDERTITVMLPDSAGLFVGNDVGVLGVPVGSITALRPDGEVVVATLSITNASLKIPADAGAAVVARSVAADRYLELTPVYDHGPTMPSGATIPVTRTVTPVDFDRVLSSLTTMSNDLSGSPGATNDLGDLLDVSARTLDGRGGSIRSTITSLSAAIADVTGQRDNVTGSVRSLARLTSILSANETTVRAFIDNLASAVDLLRSERFNIGGAVQSLSATLDKIGRLAKSHRTAVHKDVVGLTEVLRNTLRSQDDLKGILDSLPVASQNFDRATSGGRLRFQMDPLSLTPVFGQLESVCETLQGLCNLIALPPSLGDIFDFLGSIGPGRTPR